MSRGLPFKELGAEALAEELFSDELPPTVKVPLTHKQKWKAGWRPRLNKLQQKAKDNPAIYKLIHGGRGSGKGHGCLHELVEHCYLEKDALGIIVVREVGNATGGGAWEKLEYHVLPVWRDGNFEPANIKVGNEWVKNPKSGKKIDDGIGLFYTESKLDAQTKKPHLWIANIHGGFSHIILISLPVAHQIASKIKGKEPSFIFVDEAQTFDDRSLFEQLLQQLSRRVGIEGPQKMVLACNPSGPLHFLYKIFFEEPINQETREWDSRFFQININYEDNLENLPLNYYRDAVLVAVRGNPIEYQRMVEGRWVEKPEGEPLFGSRFLENVHVFPPPTDTRNRNKCLMPIPNQPMIVSYDLGAAHTSLHFLQIVADLQKINKLVIDELPFVGEYVKYRDLVPKIIGRQMQWEERCGQKFQWIHISDNSAFNQYRAKEGSFDAWDIEEISREFVTKKNRDGDQKFEDRFIIRMLECPKGPHSIEARVRMVLDDLEDGSLIVSSICDWTRDMLMTLPPDKKFLYKPHETHNLTHIFDSMTYGFFFYDKRRMRTPLQTKKIVPMAYSMGAS